MNKLKKGFLVMVAFMYGATVFAQNIDAGKKFFFYERYQSAKNVFSQLVSANPNDIDAVYWLGQAEIQLKDTAAAKALYQKTLLSNSNSPLLLVGMGHIELLEGKTQDARQRFETAISLSDGKNIPVLNAIGFANVDAKNGDVNYAIDKLKQATNVRHFKDPDVYINLGDAYSKILNGGMALTAYDNAIALDKNDPRGSYRIGKIYLTQGAQQQDVFMKYFNDAIAKDSTFGPVYYQLYSYFYRRDVNLSKGYLYKYIANSDPDPSDCYYEASILYASALFQQSINKSDQCIAAGGDHPYPNLFGLKAYAYDKLADSANARKDSANTAMDSVTAKKDSIQALGYAANANTFFEEYLTKQAPDKIGTSDYSTYAKNLLKFPGNDSLAGINIDKAIALDTLESDKIKDATVMLSYYSQNTNPNGMANWYKKIISVRKQPFLGDYQSAGFNYYMASNFPAAAAIFDSATHLFPNEVYCYYMEAKSKWGIDSTMSLGLANPYFQKAIEIGQSDTAKNKPYLVGSYNYFIGYYANVKNDKDSALIYCNKILAIDPTNTNAQAYKVELMKMIKQPARKP